jgi:RES domain-containing protein
LAYRGHTPKWAFAPTSGEGAAVHGGRFNPKGVPALYLATTPEGAFREATRGFAHKFDPLTLVTYEVDCDDVFDLSSENARNVAGIGMEAMTCPWFEDISDGKRPASWTIYDRLSKTAAGLLVPSFAIGASLTMTNLVLWDWAEIPPHAVRVFDPQKRLPKDQTSWS